MVMLQGGDGNVGKPTNDRSGEVARFPVESNRPYLNLLSAAF